MFLTVVIDHRLWTGAGKVAFLPTLPAHNVFHPYPQGDGLVQLLIVYLVQGLGLRQSDATRGVFLLSYIAQLVWIKHEASMVSGRLAATKG
jgi:hypothetical protein